MAAALAIRFDYCGSSLEAMEQSACCIDKALSTIPIYSLPEVFQRKTISVVYLSAVVILST
jgi:hypothetical protein